MSDEAAGGFSYEVSDEQLAAYGRLPIDRRVRWVEETARMTFSLATPAVRARWAALRRGEPIDVEAFSMTVRDDIRGGKVGNTHVAGRVASGCVRAGDELEFVNHRSTVVRARVLGVSIGRNVVHVGRRGDDVWITFALDPYDPEKIALVRTPEG